MCACVYVCRQIGTFMGSIISERNTLGANMMARLLLSMLLIALSAATSLKKLSVRQAVSKAIHSDQHNIDNKIGQLKNGLKGRS